MPPRLVPVDGNPFEETLPPASGPRLVPVEGNPFTMSTAGDIRAAVQARATRRNNWRRLEDAAVGATPPEDTLTNAALAYSGELKDPRPSASVTRATPLRSLEDAPPAPPPLRGAGADRSFTGIDARINRNDWQRGESSITGMNRVDDQRWAMSRGNRDQVTLTHAPEVDWSGLPALLRGAGRSAIPTTGGVAAFGPGFAAGGGLGAIIGGGTPAEAITVPVGAIGGGLATSLGAGWILNKLQDEIFGAAPDLAVTLGQDPATRARDAAEHPLATTIGQYAPMALFLRPGGLGAAPVREGAGALERALAHPVGSRVISGGLFGGQEAGRELASGEDFSPRNVAVATGIGAIFNRPTQLGEEMFNRTALGAARLGGRAYGAARDAFGTEAPPAPDFENMRSAGAGSTATVAPGDMPLLPAPRTEGRAPPPPPPEIVPPAPPAAPAAGPRLVPVEGDPFAPVATPEPAPPPASDSQIPTDQTTNNNRLPDPGPLQDGEHYVSTAQGDKVRTRFQVIPAAGLEHASGDLQNRDRTRAASDVQVQDIIGNFDPARLGASAEADRGAPIVGPDAVIESGNGRVMALNKIYDAYPEQAQAYRDFITSQGHDIPSWMDRPVLIRVRTSPLDDNQRRQFVVDANRSAIMEMTPTERARSDADILDGHTLGLYRGGDIGAAGNRDFVRAFQGRLPASEQGALIDSSGALNQAGVKRVENALMARAYENPDVLEKLLEARDNNIRSIGGAMLDNSGAWGRLRADAAEGRVRPEFDVTPQLVEAARLVSDARNSGTKIGDLLAQHGMFGATDPVTEQFIRAFHDSRLARASGRDAIGQVLSRYVTRASEQTTGPRLFGGEQMSPADILQGILSERDAGAGDDLFATAAEDRAPGTRRSPILADRASSDGPSGSPPQRSPRSKAIPEGAASVFAIFRNTAKMKAHPDYEAAKGGDIDAAVRLVSDLVPQDVATEAARRFGGATFVPVVAVEATGENAIPIALAARLAIPAGGDVTDAIVQVNEVRHTGAGAVERLLSRPEFGGKVERDAPYVIVDDVAALGGTIAELAEHITANGGNVVGTVVLADMTRTGVLSVDPAVLQSIEEKGLSDAIRQDFGIEPSALTGPEAIALDRFKTADALRDRIAAARSRREDQAGDGGVQGSASGLTPGSKIAPLIRAIDKLEGDPDFEPDPAEDNGDEQDYDTKPATPPSGDAAPDEFHGVLEDAKGGATIRPRLRATASHGAIARATADALDEPLEDKPDYTVGRSAPMDKPSVYDPEFMERSFTNRESIYDTAAVAAGHDPAKFRLLPGPQQIKILGTVIKDTFGVTVEVAAGMQDRFAIDQLLDAFQNMQGMAHILGLPLKALSLGGRLVLHLQKTARFLGAYQPVGAKIMLPGRSNSFSHEWGHGFDYYLLDLMGDGLGRGLSGAIRARGERMQGGDLDPSRNVREAFIDYLNAMFFDDAALAARVFELEKKIAAAKAEGQKARFQAQIDNIRGGSSQMRSGRTRFYRNAKAIDGPGEEGPNTYWTSPTEMLARSFEAYVSYRAELQGFTTEFIGKGDAEYLSNADERFAKTFPKEEERERIFAALDVLFDRVAAQEMLGVGPGADPPIPVTATRADIFRPPVLPKGGVFQRLLGVELGAWQDFMIRRAKAAADRPNNPKGYIQKTQDVVSFFTYGMTSRWKMLARRYNSPTLLKLHDLLTHNTGSGRFTARGLIHATRLRENQYINRIDRALERNGFPRKGDVRKELTIDEGRILRDLLISEKVPGAPDNLVKMAAEMRRLEDEIFYDLQRVGIDVGYTRNGHLQRMVDVPKVLNNQAGFVDKAGEVYELVFDRDHGGPEDILSDDDSLAKFIKLARRLAKQGHDTDPKPVTKLIRQIHRLGDNPGEDPDQTQAKVDRLSAELADLFAELHGNVRSAFAEQAANDWLIRILSANPDEFDKRGPDNSFTKKRRLPPEADKILEDFYINDPVEVMATYSHAAARRIEYAARFGQDSKKLGQMFDQMAVEGVASEDIEAVRDMLNIVTGRQAQRASPSRANFYSAVHLIWGTIALLPRATFSSLVESLTAGVVMENPVYGIKALCSLVEGALGTANARERREIARFIGLVEAQGGANVLANRFGGTYGDATRWDRIGAKMFYKTGLVALTRAQHTHIIAPAHAFLDGLAGRIIAGASAAAGGRAHKDAQDAIARFNELGIRDPAAFAKEIRSAGRIPNIDELTAAMEGRNPYAFDWITAIDRIKDQVIQNPSAMDRPEAASSQFGRFAYGIQAFNYAFYRNIIKGSVVRFYERAKRNGYGYSSEKLAFGLLPSVAALLLAQTVVSTVREYLTNHRRWEQRKADGTLWGDMTWLGITRTFGTPIDPLVQGFTGLKYERDLSAVPLGPAIGNIAQNLQAIAMLAVRNSPNTNTAEYNALRGLYRLGIGPVAGTALSAVPGGPIVSGLLGFGTGYVTAPTAGDEFAAMFVGEKARRRHGPQQHETDALFPEAAPPRGRLRDALFPGSTPASSSHDALDGRDATSDAP